MLFQITESQALEVEVTITGVSSEEGGAMVLLADTFDEYTVTAAVAMDTGPEDLPISLKLTHTNYVVSCIELLMEENLELISFFVCVFVVVM